jgi:hypothetical protein
MERIALGIFFRSKKVVGSLMLSSFYDLPFPFSIKTSTSVIFPPDLCPLPPKREEVRRGLDPPGYFFAIWAKCVKKTLRNLGRGVQESVERRNASFQSCDSGALSQASQPFSGSMRMERANPAGFSAEPGEASRIVVARPDHSFGERRKIFKS